MIDHSVNDNKDMKKVYIIKFTVQRANLYVIQYREYLRKGEKFRIFFLNTKKIIFN